VTLTPTVLQIILALLMSLAGILMVAFVLLILLVCEVVITGTGFVVCSVFNNKSLERTFIG
jgi:hypothetical protein